MRCSVSLYISNSVTVHLVEALMDTAEMMYRFSVCGVHTAAASTAPDQSYPSDTPPPAPFAGPRYATLSRSSLSVNVWYVAIEISLLLRYWLPALPSLDEEGKGKATASKQVRITAYRLNPSNHASRTNPSTTGHGPYIRPHRYRRIHPG